MITVTESTLNVIAVQHCFPRMIILPLLLLTDLLYESLEENKNCHVLRKTVQYNPSIAK